MLKYQHLKTENHILRYNGVQGLISYICLYKNNRFGNFWVMLPIFLHTFNSF